MGYSLFGSCPIVDASLPPRQRLWLWASDDLEMLAKSPTEVNPVVIVRLLDRYYLPRSNEVGQLVTRLRETGYRRLDIQEVQV